MKVLLIVSLLSFLFVANAKISDEVLSCRWHVFGGDFKVLYINIDEPTVPRKETIDRFCSQVRKYEECVANVESEQLTVELMQGMCEYGFNVVYNNITCLQKAVNKIRSTCLPRQGDCASSVEWFRCSEMVTRDLCGEALAFIMEVLQPLYCEITEALQSDQPIPYDLVPFHSKMDSLDIDEEATEKEKAVISIKVSEEGQNTKTKTETDSSPKVTVKPPSDSKIDTTHAMKPTYRTIKGSTQKTSVKLGTSMKPTHRTTKGSTQKTSVKPGTSLKPTHRTTKGSTQKTSVKPGTSMKPTHRTTKSPPPTTSMKPRTSMKPTHRTTKGPKPQSSVKPRTTMKPTHVTTKGPKPPITTHSGNSQLTSSGNFVLSVVVGTLLMNNF